MSNSNFEEIYYIDSKQEDAVTMVSTYLSDMMKEFYEVPSGYIGCPRIPLRVKSVDMNYETKPVFVCIGSDRVTGDSLGPMIGTWLQGQFNKDISVYGTLEMPIHALNLSETLSAIKSQHPNEILIAIDASLGTRNHQGYITIGRGSLLPGAGVNKQLDAVGDIFITGIVGVSGRFSHLTLQTTRLSNVIALGERIAQGILQACNSYRLAPDDEKTSFFACSAPHPIDDQSLTAKRYIVR